MFESYLEWLKYGQCVSQNTLINYSGFLRKFERFLDGKKVNMTNVQMFQIKLSKQKLKPSSVNKYLFAIRGYLKWLGSQGIECMDYEKIKIIKTSLPETQYLTKEELEKFFKEIPPTKIGIRDKALLTLLYVTGMRSSELLSINRKDINWKDFEIKIKGKNNKIRTAFLTDECALILSTYLVTRKDDFKALFNSIGKRNKLKRLSQQSVHYTCVKYALKAHIKKKMSPHVLRRSFATNLVMNGCPVTAVQEMLGHASITTTQIYIRFRNPEIKECHKKYLPSLTQYETPRIENTVA